MAYQISRYNRQILTVVDDGVIDTTAADITFIGKNYSRYGEIQNQNFLYLLENFAGSNPPPRPLSGQLWFDDASKKIKVYDGFAWKNSEGATVSNIQPINPSVGDFWWDSASSRFFIYDGSGFVLIGPQRTKDSNTQMQTVQVNDSFNVKKYVICGIANNKVIFVISDQEFLLSSVQPHTELNFSSYDKIKRGITLSDTKDSAAGITTSDYRYWGTASNSEKLGGLTASQYLTRDTENSININEIKTDIIKPNLTTTVVVDRDLSVTNNLTVANEINGFDSLKFFRLTVPTWTIGTNSSHSVLSVTKDNFNINFNSSTNRISSSTGTKIENGMLETILDSQIKDISNFTTTNLAEGDNLYFTQARARSSINVEPNSGLTYNSNTGVIGLPGLFQGQITDISNFTTDDLSQGTKNEYFTTQKARNSISIAPNSNMSYNPQTGVLGFESGFAAIPVGGIIMWSGSQIPTGWALCNGLNVTPDLRNRFVVGSGSSYSVGDTGGTNSVTLTASQIPSHSHSAGNLQTSSSGSHNHVLFGNDRGSNAGQKTAPGLFVDDAERAAQDTNTIQPAGAHTHGITGTTGSVGDNQPHENRPPYYALAFIMKL
jgi:microcystin-dependent protein